MNQPRLALADSIAKVGWDLNDQAERYVQWMKHGKYSVNGRCFDIGITTSRALHTFMESKDATLSGSRSESSSGNGSIMRLAPVPIRYHSLFPNNIPELAKLAEESSMTTHGSEQCLSACRYMALVLSALIHGEDRNKVLSPTWEPLADLNAAKPLHPLILAVAEGSFKEKQPPAIRGSGWVVQSLEAALWASHEAKDFEEACVEGSRLWAKTPIRTAAVAGQFAGAFWGERHTCKSASGVGPLRHA